MAGVAYRAFGSRAMALKLALVTGQRIGEVTGITLDEIDFAEGVVEPSEGADEERVARIPFRSPIWRST